MIHLGSITDIKGNAIEKVDCITGGSPSYKVYQYIFPNGKVYVGMTKNSIEQRRDMGYNHNKPLQKAIREYGWNGFEHKIIADNLTILQAEKIEKETIEKYKSNIPDNGYNISAGGRATYAGLKHTEEYKKKMSELYKGRSFSDKTLSRMKEAHKKERKAVISFTLSGELFMKFESLHHAAQAVNGYPSNISRACNNGEPYKALKWAFDERR